MITLKISQLSGAPASTQATIVLIWSLLKAFEPDGGIVLAETLDLMDISLAFTSLYPAITKGAEPPLTWQPEVAQLLCIIGNTSLAKDGVLEPPVDSVNVIDILAVQP